jgi:DNA-binding NarL/FixJ family response regulator
VTEADESLVRVLLVDDQELVRSGLRRILRRRDGVLVVGECEDGDQVDAAVRENRPDVVVMDLRMRRVNGIDAILGMRRQPGDAPPVLVLTTFDDDQLLAGALRAGAAGFLLKDSPAEDVVRGVLAVAAGQAVLDPAVTSRVLDTFRSVPEATPAPDTPLTDRELEVLQLMGRGLSNGEIASTLVISEVTVKSHIGRIFTKLDLRDRAAAIVYAFDRGLVSPSR